MSPARGQYKAVVSYEQAHLRLKTDKGRPDSFECETCGSTAREWAYLGGDPEELTCPKTGRIYSLDQSFYVPLCVSCHRRRDRAMAEGRSVEVCPRGHLWAENESLRKTRSKSVGLRFCRACHREDSRRYQASKLARSLEAVSS